jgi:hypothetical protein
MQYLAGGWIDKIASFLVDRKERFLLVKMASAKTIERDMLWYRS